MARARNIKPGFFRNADLVELPYEARLLFIGLWTLADREGRLEDRPKQIKMEIFPADNLDCNDLLDQLAGTGMVVRYTHGGKRYLQVVNFAKHQNPHHQEAKSKIPAPDSTSMQAVENQGETEISSEQALDKPEISPGQALDKPETSPGRIVLIPDSLIPDSKPSCASLPMRDCASAVSFGPNVHPIAAPSVAATPAKRAEHKPEPGGFGEFWAAYPKKRSKGDAEKAWAKIRPDKALLSKILLAVEAAKAGGDWQKDDGRFIPYPSSWLNAKGWEDDIPGQAMTETESLFARAL